MSLPWLDGEAAVRGTRLAAVVAAGTRDAAVAMAVEAAVGVLRCLLHGADHGNKAFSQKPASALTTTGRTILTQPASARLVSTIPDVVELLSNVSVAPAE